MYDFGGWATKYNMKCSDGRTILKDAFAHQDNTVIPLVWNHIYDSVENVIGKATLMHRDEGVYAHCEFNDSSQAQAAKSAVKHGDITSLSIFANKLKQKSSAVVHGNIKEVSLVLAGANPGAYIEEVLIHGEADDEMTATIYNDELIHFDSDAIEHSSKDDQNEEDVTEKDDKETVADVYNTLNDKQKKAVAIIIDQLSEEQSSEDDNKEGEPDMKHNVFDQTGKDTIKHTEFDFEGAVKDAKRCGSFKEAFLSHAASYGVENIDTLFPEARDINNEPGFIDRDQTWVGGFLAGVKKSPFSRIKVIHADITSDPARAKGYIKGNLKKEEVFSLLKRTTMPTTIYKKQKLDRDDIIDITSFDVVAWMKREMRGKLDEEIARAMLIGDGRTASHEDKVKEDCIRPIYNDSELYTIKKEIAAAQYSPKEFIKACLKSRVDYEGKGQPNLYTTEDMISELLLIEDANGRFIYESIESLAKVLRVKSIIAVPVMNKLVRPTTDSKKHEVLGILVNPADYMVGADKGGDIGMFDDFDIDYNQYKYLIETRCSGSLTEPKTAITIEKVS